jgi:hypothetical protein
MTSDIPEEFQRLTMERGFKNDDIVICAKLIYLQPWRRHATRAQDDLKMPVSNALIYATQSLESPRDLLHGGIANFARSHFKSSTVDILKLVETGMRIKGI